MYGRSETTKCISLDDIDHSEEPIGGTIYPGGTKYQLVKGVSYDINTKGFYIINYFRAFMFSNGLFFRNRVWLL